MFIAVVQHRLGHVYWLVVYSLGLCVHTENSISNLVELNQIWIAITHMVWYNKIPKIFTRMYMTTKRWKKIREDPQLVPHHAETHKLLGQPLKNTQRKLFGILLMQTEIRLYLPFSIWFWSKQTSVWIRINREMVNTILWKRFQKVFLVFYIQSWYRTPTGISLHASRHKWGTIEWLS